MDASGCKHIYFFSSFNPSSVSARCRGLYPLQFLRKNRGIKFDFVYPGYRISELSYFLLVFFKVLLFRKKKSVVVFHKLHSRGVYTSLLKVLLRFRSKNTLYDTDDADYIRYEGTNIYHFVENCSACTVGSDFLRRHFLEISSTVVKLTSPVLNHGKRKDSKNASCLHLGWVGDFGVNEGELSDYCHKRSFNKLILPALKLTKAKVKLTILGIRNPRDGEEIRSALRGHENIELEFPNDIDWMNENEVYERIAAFDVGLSPLVNHDFNKAKSAFKVKQYLSCGIPVLASPVGENRVFVSPAENGFFCEDSYAFVKGIETFLSMSEEEYRCFSRNALQTRSDYSVELFSGGLKKVLDQLTLSKAGNESSRVPLNS